MQYIEFRDDEKAVLKQVGNKYAECSGMTQEDREFLNAMILRYEPKKILELGVAGGSSSVIILNAIKDLENAHLYSIDYADTFFADKTKKAGYIVDEYSYLKDKWTFYHPGMAYNYMEKIGGNIDFCFIDTVHKNPGELLDFLMVLPFLKKNCVVLFHDVNLHQYVNEDIKITNNLLMSAVKGEKIIPVEYQDYFANISGVILDDDIKEHVWEIFNLLCLKWHYFPSDSELSELVSFFEKHYSKEYVDMFKNIIRYQKEKVQYEKKYAYIVKNQKWYMFKCSFYSFLARFFSGKVREKFEQKKMKYAKFKDLNAYKFGYLYAKNK